MKKHVCTLLVLLGVAVFSGTAFAADVAITSVGQTSDGMMIKVLMKKLNIRPEYDAVMPSGKLADQKVLIAVVGGSSKGLGAAGINRDEEKARGVKLLEDAKKKGIKVLVMHIGGDRRRGELTDVFIEAVAGLGDRLIIVKSGNADGIFTKNKAADAELVEVDTVQATLPPLEAAFKEWGVSS